jgi:UPF0755 protein
VTDLDLDTDERDAREVEQAERGRRRRVVVALVLLVAVPLVAVLGGAIWFWWQLDPPGSAGATVDIEIVPGWGISEIGDELAREGVVGSSFVFRTYSRATGAGPFQAGRYELRRDLGVRGAIDVLEAGPVLTYHELAVPPGRWLSEVAALVEAQLPGRSAARFLALAQSGAVRSRFQPDGQVSLEGYLWPDTYRFTDEEDELDVLRTMVEQFDAVGERLGLDGASVEGNGAAEIVVIASLVQQEAKVDEDRPLIASVVYNRLRVGMPLQIDATVVYAVGVATGARPTSGLTVEQLRADSPYNTYVRTGLPPTPISSVTEASLRAAIEPASTPFRFYVLADERGAHVFAETYEEHLANVAEARRRGLLG